MIRHIIAHLLSLSDDTPCGVIVAAIAGGMSALLTGFVGLHSILGSLPIDPMDASKWPFYGALLTIIALGMLGGFWLLRFVLTKGLEAMNECRQALAANSVAAATQAESNRSLADALDRLTTKLQRQEDTVSNIALDAISGALHGGAEPNPLNAGRRRH